MKVHRHLDEELERLRDTVLRLGGESEAALRRAMHSLSERDRVAAREVLEHDDVVDELEVEVDRQCIDIFVLRQPAARDLRFVMSVTKIAPVLERIADHACNIARTAIDLADEPEVQERLIASRRWARLRHQCWQRLSTRLPNPTLPLRAKSFCEMLEINNLYNEIFSELIGMMVTAPKPPLAARACCWWPSTWNESAITSPTSAS